MRLNEIRKEGSFNFVVQQASGNIPGGKMEIAVYAAFQDGESALVLFRTLYFDAQSQEHIDNFCKKVAYDEHYLKQCFTGEVHWCRFARLYNANARILKEEKSLLPFSESDNHLE